MVWYPSSEGRYGSSGAKGDAGEELVKRYLQSIGVPFEHKTDYRSQVIEKIDFIISGTTRMDVKTNYYMGRLAVECWECKHQRKGWIFTTTSDTIFGVDIEGEQIFEYRVEQMREYVLNNLHRLKKTKFGDLLLWVDTGLPFIKKLK